MSWQLEFSKKADKQLSKLDPGIRKVIVSWLIKNLDGCEDPRLHGKSLKGNLSNMWRYRIGDFRVLCDLDAGNLVILAIEIGHRCEVYKR